MDIKTINSIKTCAAAIDSFEQVYSDSALRGDREGVVTAEAGDGQLLGHPESAATK